MKLHDQLSRFCSLYASTLECTVFFFLRVIHLEVKFVNNVHYIKKVENTEIIITVDFCKKDKKKNARNAHNIEKYVKYPKQSINHSNM